MDNQEHHHSAGSMWLHGYPAIPYGVGIPEMMWGKPGSPGCSGMLPPQRLASSSPRESSPRDTGFQLTNLEELSRAGMWLPRIRAPSGCSPPTPRMCSPHLLSPEQLRPEHPLECWQQGFCEGTDSKHFRLWGPCSLCRCPGKQTLKQVTNECCRSNQTFGGHWNLNFI